MNSQPPQFDAQNYYARTQSVVTQRVSAVLKRVYLLMTVALALTGIISYACANSYGYMDYFMSNSWMMWALIIAEFGIVIGVSAGINRLNTMTATLLFVIFSVINGMLLAPIFLVYTDTSIAKTFFITAGTFGAMSVYGLFTNRDLTRWGNLLFMALIGLIICSLVNMFVHSQGFSVVISFIGVLVFVGLTAWDTQQIKKMALAVPDAGAGRLAVLGALNLYLDFINLFLYLLRFFGNER